MLFSVKIRMRQSVQSFFDMDPNTSTTEPDTDYQSLILEPNFFHNSYLLQIPQPSKQVIPKKPNTCPNQRFVLLLRNLICEQVTCRFERTANLGDITSQTCSQFKFFLNSLEILCHYLNIIKPENYKYRLKDYGPYKKHLVGFPQKVETGAIITMQTYSSTLQNPDFSALSAKLSMLSRKDEMRKKISMCCQEYAFYSAQYHLRLNSIFKELNRLGTLLDNISKNWKQENQKLGSVIYEEGIWDNNKKLLYVSELNDLLRAFEASIRDYERVLIKCTIMLVDFEVEDAKRYKYSYGELRTEGSINNYNCYETPTDMMNAYNMVCKTEESMPSYAHNISHWLSDSTGGKSPQFGKNRSQLNLLELQSENVTPNIHNIKQRIYVHSSSKRQSTLKRINETSLHVVPEKAPVEVKPWAEMNIQQQPIKTASYMTPTEGKRNFSFRNADTSITKTANYNAHTKSIVKCNQTIKFSPNWEAMEAGPKKVKEIVQPSLQRVPSAPRAIPVTKSSYVAKGSRETTQIRNPMPSYFNEKKAASKKVEGGREEDKGDQIRRLFQQSNFYKGKVGASSKLLKFR